MSNFMGMIVSKETISLGLGGQIERAGEEYAPRSVVRFEASALVSSIKHKFLKDGTVEESIIMTIDPESFRVREIVEEQPTLPNV